MKNLLTILMFLALSAGIFIACNEAGSRSEAATHDTLSKELTYPPLKERKVKGANDEKLIHDRYDALTSDLKEEPDNVRKQLKVAEVYLVEARATGNGDYYYPAAMNILDHILNDNSLKEDEKFGAMLLKSSILMSLHQFKKAKKLAKKAIKINDYNAQIYGVLVDANVELGNYKEAVKMSDKMNSIRPDLRSYSRVSYIREIYGNYPGAKKAMKAAVEAGYPGYEDTEWCRVNLGRLYEKTGDIDSAEYQYRKSLYHRNGYLEASSALARVQLKKGQIDSALNRIKNVLDVRPESHYYEVLYLIQNHKNNDEKAQAAIEKAISMLNGESNHSHHSHEHDHGDETHKHDHNNKGHSHDHEHNGNGNSHGDTAGKYKHHHGLDLANLYINYTDDFDKALHNLEGELEMRPDNIDVNLAAAKAYYMKRDYKRASDHLKKASATESNRPELQLLQGLIAIEKGDMKGGKKKIKSAMELNPYLQSPLRKEAAKYMQ